MNKRVWWALVAISGLLAGCAGNNGSPSERLAERRAELDAAPQVSPDFPLDQDGTSELDANATLFGIAASSEAGYLLAYGEPYAPDVWSRPSTYSSNQLVLLHMDAGGGPASLLAQVPAPATGSIFRNARVVDVGSGWLVVYEVVTTAITRYAVTVARDGSVGAPLQVPGTCLNGMVGFVRAANTALLTDVCGNGVLLDFTGHALQTMALVNSSTFNTPLSFCPNPGINNLTGGQLAFDGIDYLVLYSCYAGSSKSVVGVPISQAGDVGTSVPVVSQPAVPYAGVTPLSIAADSGGFLAVVAEVQSSGPNTAAAYRTISETAEHVFSVGAEHTLPGESILNDGQASDHGATALALGGAFAIVRERSTGDLDLVRPSPTGTGTDTTQSLTPALLAPVALVSSNDPFAGGDRFLIAASGRAVRFDASARAIDVPAELLPLVPHGQFMPSVAFDGQSYLAAWAEGVRALPGWTQGRTPQIFGHRLSSTGALLGAASFEINPATAIGISPLVAANPGSFSAAWNGYPTAALSGAATITSADPPLVTPYAGQLGTPLDFGIATDGARTAVAWAASPSSVLIAQPASGGSWSTPLTIATSDADSTTSAPALAFNGGQYAVLWTATGDGASQRVIYGARVSAALALLDTTPNELLRFAGPGRNGRPADSGIQAIAVGDHFLIAWSTVVGSNEELRIARLSSTLQLQDPGGVLVGTQLYSDISTSTQHASLSWDGANAWVVWRDDEGGTRRPYASLRGRRFSDALVAVDAESFLISTDLDEYSKVTLARGAGDSSLVGYTRYLASAGSFRARARLLSASSFADGVPCGSASQCQDGACISGYCSTATGGGGAEATDGGGGNAGTSGTSGTVSTAGEAGSGGEGEHGGQAGGVAGSSGGDATGDSGSGSGAPPGHAAEAGEAGTGGNARWPGSQSCSYRVAGGGSTREHLPPLAGLLFAVCTALYRRRRANSH